MRSPFLQPRFTLRGLFALVTLCAIGTWYWYQRPYPVEQWVESLWGTCGNSPPSPKNYREVRHFRRVRGQEPVMHGPYRGYDLQGKLRRSGYYVNDYEHGKFIDYWSDGGRTTWNVVRGHREGETRSVDGQGNIRALSSSVHGKLHGSSRSWDISGKLIQEENHDMGVLIGKFYCRDEYSGQAVEGEYDRDFPSGNWKWSLCEADIVEVSGRFENGRANGIWEWVAANGERKLVAEFKDGKASRVEPCDFSPRVLDAILTFDHSYPMGLTYGIWSRKASGATAPTLGQLVTSIGYLLHIEPDSSELSFAGLESFTLCSEQNRNTIPLLALSDELKSRGFGYDFRYGKFCIDKIESIAVWHDQTGVNDLIAPPNSRLEEEWQTKTWISVGNMPFQKIIEKLSERHSVSFDLSLLPKTAIGESRTSVDTRVTICIEKSCFKRGLAMLLGQLNCRASLRGETIVIEAQ